MLSFIKKIVPIQVLAGLHLLMTILNIVLLFPVGINSFGTGLGSYLPLVGLSIIGGGAWDENIVLVVLGLIAEIGIFGFLVITYGKLFFKKNDKLFYWLVNVDFVIFIINAIWIMGAPLWKLVLHISYYLLVRFVKKKQEKDIEKMFNF